MATTSFTPTNSIRNAANLDELIKQADAAITTHNNQIIVYGNQGEIIPNIEWEKLCKIFKLAVREDAKEAIEARNMAKKDHQVDHVFEVQYFAAVLLHTMAEIISSGEIFYPEVADITFAVTLVNHHSNLKSLHTEFHKEKTRYFRAGSKDVEVTDRVLDLLMTSGYAFRATLQGYNGIKEAEHHGKFRRRFCENLFTTPWCNPEQWKAIVKESFSKNITLQNYVPNSWEDDNEFYNGVN